MADDKNGGDGMVSQRSENSVLFSLSNLTAISDDSSAQQQQQPQPGYASSGGGGGGGGGEEAKGENMGDKSGLIDLATLTALGAGDQAGGESGGGGDANSAAVPALFNVGTRKSSKGMRFGIFLLVLIVLGLGGFVAYLTFFKEEPAEPAAEVVDPEIKQKYQDSLMTFAEHKTSLANLSEGLLDEAKVKEMKAKLNEWQGQLDEAKKKSVEESEEAALTDIEPLLSKMEAYEKGIAEYQDALTAFGEHKESVSTLADNLVDEAKAKEVKDKITAWQTQFDAAKEKSVTESAEAATAELKPILTAMETFEKTASEWETKADTVAQAGEEGEGDDKDDKKDRKRDRDRDKKDDDDDKPKSASERISGGSSGKKLSKDDVLGVISAKTIKIRRCGSGGDVHVSWTIKKSGSISGAKVFGGSLKGSDTADCVLGVVKGMKFPSSSEETPIKYPFKL